MKTLAGKFLTIAIAAACAATAQAGDKSHDAKLQMMDSNKDGKISLTEHTAGAQQMFQGMDANQDNRVTSEEMDAHHQAMMKSSEHGKYGGKQMSSAEKIKSLDANGDGALTAEEHAMGAKKKFTKMDGDKDGSLTAAELRAGHEKEMTARDTE